jgi:hypothetical protein
MRVYLPSYALTGLHVLYVAVDEGLSAQLHTNKYITAYLHVSGG